MQFKEFIQKEDSPLRAALKEFFDLQRNKIIEEKKKIHQKAVRAIETIESIKMKMEEMV